MKKHTTKQLIDEAMKKQGLKSLAHVYPLLIDEGLSISFQSLCNWYNGAFVPKLQYAIILCRVLDIDIEELQKSFDNNVKKV